VLSGLLDLLSDGVVLFLPCYLLFFIYSLDTTLATIFLHLLPLSLRADSPMAMGIMLLWKMTDVHHDGKGIEL
jgi:hypothetical protein